MQTWSANICYGSVCCGTMVVVSDTHETGNPSVDDVHFTYLCYFWIIYFVSTSPFISSLNFTFWAPLDYRVNNRIEQCWILWKNRNPEREVTSSIRISHLGGSLIEIFLLFIFVHINHFSHSMCNLGLFKSLCSILEFVDHTITYQQVRLW